MRQMKLLTVGRSLAEFENVGHGGGAGNVALPAFSLGIPGCAGGDTGLIHRRQPGLWKRLWANLRDTSTWQVPVGYEDEAGFHYGIAPARPVDMARLAR